MEYEAQQERIAKLEQQDSVLTEALRLALHKQFGTSSEKSGKPFVERLNFLHNEAKVLPRPKRRKDLSLEGEKAAASPAMDNAAHKVLQLLQITRKSPQIT